MSHSNSAPSCSFSRNILAFLANKHFFSLLVVLWPVAFVGSAQAQSTPVTTLHYFPGNHASYGPIEGPDGNFYGADAQAAAIYRLTPSGGYSVFCSFTANGIDGPDSSLLLASDGSFWGIAHQDSTSLVYRVAPDGVFSVVHTFVFATEGGTPFSNLTQGTDGNFYGSNVSGGTHGDGTIYKLTPAGNVTILYNFSEYHGYAPTNLVQGRSGNFYGTTLFGGVNQEGSFFTVTPGGSFTTLYSFNTANASPSDVILGRDGNFYGVSAEGGANRAGTIFSLTPTGVHKTLSTFTALGKFANDPIGRLLQADDGTFFGTTSGSNATIFELTPAGNLNYLYFFGSTAPDGNLLRDADGNFYGNFALASQEGGSVILKFSPPPVASVTATVPTAKANTGQIAEVQLRLSSPVTYDLVATYEVRGTGINGVDYNFLKGEVKMKAGRTIKTIKVIPSAESSNSQLKVTAKITLRGLSGCLIDDSKSAKVDLFFPAN